MEGEPSLFDFAAEVGLTKHMGGVEATEELVELCHIGPGSRVLDVGCGAGATPVHLAKRCGCRVVGVDISECMVERSREMARREGLAEAVEFRVADAQNLPFDDDLFDAVFSESVTAFPENKQKAVDEYVRVTKPGGYVGLSESTWLRMPPPPDVVAWAAQEVGAQVRPLTRDEWVRLLEKAGLTDLVARAHRIKPREEAGGIARRYGCGGTVRILGRLLSLYATNPAYRRFVKRVRQGGVMPENLHEYLGYGLYVGRK